MHAVDRCSEPPALKPIRDQLTPKWVAHYRDGCGAKPGDSKWCDFHEDLHKVFFGLCAYCESECKGEVEHFRPKSRYPHKVYEWTNWVLACHVCNNKKGGRWPTGGYVDPCAKTTLAQPETHFKFDTTTGEILVKDGLTPARRRRAENTIKNLGLNAYHQCKKRVVHLDFVSKALKCRPENDPDTVVIVDFVASNEHRLSSITRSWLREHGHEYDGT